MFELLFLGLVILVSLALVSHQFIKFSWLQATAGAIIISLPFERIPSIDIAGATLRLSQLLTLIGLYLFVILFVKKDPSLMRLTLHKKSLWILLFFVVSLPSALFAINGSRYLVTMVATILSFSTLFLVSNFTKNLKQKIYYLCLAYLLVTIFAIYQISGDMLGLPVTLTGIKPMFSAFIFGIPRVHATFNEPSYYANSLFLFISLFFFWSALEVNIFQISTIKQPTNIIQRITSKVQNSKLVVWCKDNYQLFYQLLLLTFVVLFLFTISKGAWLVSPVLLIYCLYYGKRYNLYYFTKFFIGVGLVFLIATAGLLTFSSGARQTAENIYSHLIASVNNNSATAMERSMSARTALFELYPNNAITGIGSGQYGTYAQEYILASEVGQLINRSTADIIVFNVYIEVLLEFGLLAFIIFMYIFLHSLWHNHQQMKIKHNELFSTGNDISSVSQTKRYYLALRLAMGGAIIMFMLQWNFISPIYINPIFISLGILLNIDQDKLLYYED
jgi:hypothetical protein